MGGTGQSSRLPPALQGMAKTRQRWSTGYFAPSQLGSVCEWGRRGGGNVGTITTTTGLTAKKKLKDDGPQENFGCSTSVTALAAQYSTHLSGMFKASEQSTPATREFDWKEVSTKRPITLQNDESKGACSPGFGTPTR